MKSTKLTAILIVLSTALLLGSLKFLNSHTDNNPAMPSNPKRISLEDELEETTENEVKQDTAVSEPSLSPVSVVKTIKPNATKVMLFENITFPDDIALSHMILTPIYDTQDNGLKYLTVSEKRSTLSLQDFGLLEGDKITHFGNETITSVSAINNQINT